MEHGAVLSTQPSPPILGNPLKAAVATSNESLRSPLDLLYKSPTHHNVSVAELPSTVVDARHHMSVILRYYLRVALCRYT